MLGSVRRQPFELAHLFAKVTSTSYLLLKNRELSDTFVGQTIGSIEELQGHRPHPLTLHIVN